MTPSDAAAKLRLDKWLWHARLFKSRTIAAAQIAGGGFRVNKVIVRKSHHIIQPGDVVTFAKGPYVRVVEIVALGARRGPAVEAQGLYRDLNSPESQPRPDRARSAAPGPGWREPGAGRPTKKQRRETDRLQGDC
jgi:ribosome-associated heat shock protein Hsp15